MDVIKMAGTRLELYTKDIEKAINKAEAQYRKKAVQHAAKIMRRNLADGDTSLPGDFPSKQTGELQKSIGYKLITGKPGTSFVGSKSSVAHLLEFGHGDGKVYNKRPFVRRTLDEEADKIEEIMSNEYF